FDTVKPTRAGPSSSRRHAWSVKAGPEALAPAAAPRKSARCLIRSMAGRALEHDPEKWTPVFGKDHAPGTNACDVRHSAACVLARGAPRPRAGRPCFP